MSLVLDTLHSGDSGYLGSKTQEAVQNTTETQESESWSQRNVNHQVSLDVKATSMTGDSL